MWPLYGHAGVSLFLDATHVGRRDAPERDCLHLVVHRVVVLRRADMHIACCGWNMEAVPQQRYFQITAVVLASILGNCSGCLSLSPSAGSVAGSCALQLKKCWPRKTLCGRVRRLYHVDFRGRCEVAQCSRRGSEAILKVPLKGRGYVRNACLA